MWFRGWVQIKADPSGRSVSRGEQTSTAGWDLAKDQNSLSSHFGFSFEICLLAPTGIKTVRMVPRTTTCLVSLGFLQHCCDDQSLRCLLFKQWCRVRWKEWKCFTPSAEGRNVTLDAYNEDAGNITLTTPQGNNSEMCVSHFGFTLYFLLPPLPPVSLSSSSDSLQLNIQSCCSHQVTLLLTDVPSV